MADEVMPGKLAVSGVNGIELTLALITARYIAMSMQTTSP